jgi:hypothetical protein
MRRGEDERQCQSPTLFIDSNAWILERCEGEWVVGVACPKLEVRKRYSREPLDVLQRRNKSKLDMSQLL